MSLVAFSYYYYYGLCNTPTGIVNELVRVTWRLRVFRLTPLYT